MITLNIHCRVEVKICDKNPLEDHYVFAVLRRSSWLSIVIYFVLCIASNNLYVPSLIMWRVCAIVSRYKILIGILLQGLCLILICPDPNLKQADISPARHVVTSPHGCLYNPSDFYNPPTIMNTCVFAVFSSSHCFIARICCDM